MSSTPPQYGLTGIPATPIKTGSSTTGRYVPKYENRDDILSRLAVEMGPYFVGPIPVQGFLDSFLPLSDADKDRFKFKFKFKGGMFNTLIRQLDETENRLYDTFVSSPTVPVLRSNPTFPD